MGDVRLSLPRVRVQREGHDPIELQVLNPDLLRWDTTRAKHRWPAMKDAPHLWLTFLAWSAASRTGATADRWETFRDTVLEVATIDADAAATSADDLAADWQPTETDDDGGEAGFPTHEDPGPD